MAVALGSLYEADEAAWLDRMALLIRKRRYAELDDRAKQALELAFARAVERAANQTGPSVDEFPDTCPYAIEDLLKNRRGVSVVRIRMKKLGRKHRAYFRIVAIDGRQPRDGKVIEELGSYDPMVKDTNSRVTLKPDRIKYWLGVGAQPSERCALLFKKYMKKFEQQPAPTT